MSETVYYINSSTLINSTPRRCKMKNIVLFMVFLLLLATASIAQENVSWYEQEVLSCAQNNTSDDEALRSCLNWIEYGKSLGDYLS